jgi:hypothetical protein
MQYIIGFGIAGIILYFLVIGGILIWPLINVAAYLKVLIFPRAVRKKYGSSAAILSNDSFDQEITDEDNNEVETLHSLATKLNSRRTKVTERIPSQFSGLVILYTNTPQQVAPMRIPFLPC